MKWIFRLIGVVIALVVFLVGAVFFLPADRLARIATEQLAAATGRDVSINGEVSLTFWPVLGVSADDLEVGNADWAAQGPMFQAANAAIGVDAMSLLRGDIRIRNIEAHSPTIRLEQKLDGRASWQFTDGSGSGEIRAETAPKPKSESSQSASTPSERSFSIERLEVTDATLIYDAEGSDQVSLSGVDLTLDWPDPAGPAQIAGVVRPAGSPVEIALDVDAFADFIGGEVSGLRANVKAQDGSIALDGRASTSGAVAGALSLSTGNTDAFLRALGLPGVDLPPKLGRSITASTDLTLTPDRQLALRDLNVDLGGNKLTGAADIGLNGTPQINAQLDAGALDVSPASGGGSSGSSGSGGGGSSGSAKKSKPGWPKDPIDASGLAAFNGDIALSAQSINLGTFSLGPTRTVLRNDNSRMVFELREVAAYGGNVTGEFVVNNRSGLSVGGNMNIASIQMQPLLADAVDFDRLTGQGNLALSFLGSGPSVDAIMKSLSGDGSLSIGRGTIEGINLDQLLRGGSMSGTTIFDDLTASWTIASGVLSNRDLLLQLKNYRATGDGTVDIGRQRLDYKVTPVALRANSGEGIAVPVIFKGPWSDVSIRPDLEAVLDAQLEEQQKKLEQKAREKLNDKLGVESSKGKSLEDTLKDEAADQLLKKLFD